MCFRQRSDRKIGVLDHFRALSALDQYLDGAVGELEQLQYARKRANLVDRLCCRIVVGGVLLGGEQDEGAGPHHLLEREDRLLAPDEEGRDHVRKYDDVAQRQHRIGSGLTWCKRWAWLCSGHGPKSVLLFLSAAACAQPRQSADGPGKEYGPPQRYPRPKGRYDTLCPSARPHPPKKPNDSRRLWVGNHQDSSDAICCNTGGTISRSKENPESHARYA